MWWFLLATVAVGGLAQLIDGSLGTGFGTSGCVVFMDPFPFKMATAGALAAMATPVVWKAVRSAPAAT